MQRTNESVYDGVVVFPKAAPTPTGAESGIKLDLDDPGWGWRDLTGVIQPKASGAGSPTRQIYAGGQLADYAFALNDVCDINFHTPHDHVPGTDMFVHVHWSHTGTAISGTAEFTVYHSYSRGHNQANFPAEKSVVITVPTPNIATIPRYRHRVDEVALTSAGGSASLLDNALIEVDGLHLTTIKLTQLPVITGGNLFIHTVDIHYQSSNLATKQKSPNFYI